MRRNTGISDRSRHNSHFVLFQSYDGSCSFVPFYEGLTEFDLVSFHDVPANHNDQEIFIFNSKVVYENGILMFKGQFLLRSKTWYREIISHPDFNGWIRQQE